MAFGAQIKLSVDKSSKAKFRGEIQEFVNVATASSPIRLKSFKIDISAQQRQQMVSQLQESISKAELIIKIKKVDASDAISGLRSQLTTMLGGLQIGGLRSFLGAEGVESAYDRASASANRLAEATENARKKAVAANVAIKELGLIQNTLSSTYKAALNVGDNEKLNQYIVRYRELAIAIENARTLEGDAQREAVAGISSATAALNQEVAAQIASEKAAAKKAASAETAEEAERRRAIEAENNSRKENNLARQAIQLRQQINTYIAKNTGAYQQYSGKIDGLLTMLQNESGLSAAQLSLIAKEFAAIKSEAAASGVAGQTFFEKLKAGWSKFGGWSIVTKTMMSAVNTVKKMITAVKDLDAAMTELRKVTDLTEAGYNVAFNKAADTAMQIGAKVSDTINATADFARLGYNVNDAANLASAALIYKNVGDGIDDISIATESLISTIKGFGLAATDAMHIVDAFNEVGNNFAISSVGIGEALQKSASALAAAGNSMEESIGLVVGMNNVLQNPEQVGTILKTSSMYLRAAKTELEEAGESTEGMVTSVSKLREELLSLTGVDIQIDENTFKSTFQIYKELSQVWESLSDITQANVIEKIGGKRNANGIISLLTNFADAEDAMRTALDSTGSAVRENEKWLDSIQGKLAEFSAAFEKLSSGLIDSNLMKTIIGTGTALLTVLSKLVDLFGALPILIGAVSAALSIMGYRMSIFGTSGDKVVLLTKGFKALYGAVKESITKLVAGKSAIKALGDQATASAIKAKALSNVLNTLAPMAIAMLLTAIPTWISGWIDAQKEARQAAIDAGKEAAKESEAIGDALSKYSEMSKALTDGTATRESYQSSVEALLKVLGVEGETVESLTEKYGSLDAAISQLSLGALEEKERELRAGLSAAKTTLLDEYNDWNRYWGKENLSSQIRLPMTFGGYDQSYIDAANELIKRGLAISYSQTDPNTFLERGFNLNLPDIDFSSVEGLIDAYSRYGQMLDVLGDTLGDTTGNALYQTIFKIYSTMGDFISEVTTATSGLNENLAQQYVEIGKIDNGLPNTKEEYSAFRQSVIDAAIASNEFQGSTEQVAAAVDSVLSQESWAQKFINEAAGASGAIDGVTAKYQKFSDAISDVQKGFNIYKSAIDEMNDGGGISANTLSSIESLLGSEESLNDFVTVQDGVLVLNTQAWNERTIALYENEIAALQLANATETDTNKIADNNAIIGIYTALIRNLRSDIENVTADTRALGEVTEDVSKSFGNAEAAIDGLGKVGSTIELTYDAYRELVAIDTRYMDVVEYQNGILTINREKYEDITAAITRETLAQAEAAQQAILTSDEYQDLMNRIDDLSDQERDRLNDLNAEILGYSVLANEIDNATSAYERFLGASDDKSAGRFEAAQKAFNVINDTQYNDESDLYGKIGRDQYKQAVEFVIGVDIDPDSPEWKRGFDLAKRYFEDEGQGAVNFYNDLVSHGIMDATTGTMNASVQEIASSLGVTEDTVRAMIDTINLYQEEAGKIKVEDNPLKDAQSYAEGAQGAADGAKTAMETAKENADALSTSTGAVVTNIQTINTTPVIVNTSAAESSISSVYNGLGNILDRLNTIGRTSVTANVNVNESSSSTSTSSGGILGRLFGWAAAGGISGARNSVRGGKTLVGELGMETVVDPYTNKWYTVGENGAQFVTLPKGAIVFNAEQTKSLFGSGKTSDRGQSMASGNAAVSLAGIINGIATAVGVVSTVASLFKKNSDTASSSGTKKPTSTKKKSSSKRSGGSSSSSSSSEPEEVKDPYEELKKHYTDLNDQIEHLIEHQQFLYKQAERGLNFENMEASLRVQAAKYQEIMRTSQEAVSALTAKGAKDTDEAVQEMERAYWNAYDELNSVLDQINGLYVDALTNKIDDVQNAYKNLSAAADDFSKYGGITVDTFQALIANGAQYLSLLKNVDGQYVINEDAIRNIIAAQKEQLAIETALSYISQLKEALTNKDVNAVQNLVSLTNQISDSGWDQVYSQVALLQTLGLTDVQYQQILNNIQALRDISSSVITDIVDGTEELADTYDKQKDALDNILDLTQDLIKYETDQKIKAIEDQIDAYKDLIDLKKKSLETTRDESKYEDSIAEKVKSIAKLQTQIDQLSLDDSRAAIAERLSLMEELADLQKELGDAQSSHAYDNQVDALDQMADSYDNERQTDIEALENSISSAEKLYQAAIQRIDTQWDTLYADLISWNTEAGNTLNSEITENWNLASEAVLRYGSYLKALDGIEASISQTEGGSVVANAIPRYHGGGIVGSDDKTNSREIVAILEKGEIVLDQQKKEGLYQIIDFQEELSKRLGSSIKAIDASSVRMTYGDIAPDDLRHEIIDNSSMNFSPNINVEINAGGDVSDSSARSFGNKVASTALDALKEAFTRRGINNLGGAKLAQG